MTSQTGKQLKYTYCPISQEVKVIRQRKLVSLWNITWEISFLKNHTQNMLKKLVPDLFLKKIKIEDIRVGLSKYIETKVLTMCFYVTQRFFLSKTLLTNCLIAFTSWDIVQYMSCNYLFFLVCDIISFEIKVSHFIFSLTGVDRGKIQKPFQQREEQESAEK